MALSVLNFDVVVVGIVVGRDIKGKVLAGLDAGEFSWGGLAVDSDGKREVIKGLRGGYMKSIGLMREDKIGVGVTNIAGVIVGEPSFGDCALAERFQMKIFILSFENTGLEFHIAEFVAAVMSAPTKGVFIETPREEFFTAHLRDGAYVSGTGSTLR